jgi:hypothetical protein
MAIVTTSQNLTAVSYTAGEIIEIQNGATLTINSNPTIRPGTIQCITSGKLLIQNTSTTTPLVVQLEDSFRDLRFENGGILEIRGDAIEIGTSTGSVQTWDFSTLYGGAYTDITHIEVETAVGSGEYKPWPIQYILAWQQSAVFAEYSSSFFGTPTNAQYESSVELFFYNSITRVLSTGNGTNGALISAGRKIRIPNILITEQYWRPEASNAFTIQGINSPTAGTFTVTLLNALTGATIGTTAAIAYNATHATVRTALEAVLGAGTIATGSGSVPGGATFQLAGVYATGFIIPQVNSSVTPSTTSIVSSYTQNSANMSLLDITPMGVLDVEWCMFSNRIYFTATRTGNITCSHVGFGNRPPSFSAITSDVILDHVSIQTHPFVLPAIVTIEFIFGEVQINKVVLMGPFSADTGSNMSRVQYVPTLTKFDDFTMVSWRRRPTTNQLLFLISKVSENLICKNILLYGGGLRLLNQNNLTFVNHGAANTTGDRTNDPATSTGLVLVESSNNLFVNYRQLGTLADQVFATNTITNSAGSFFNRITNSTLARFTGAAGFFVSNAYDVTLTNVSVTNSVGAPTGILSGTTNVATKARKLFITGGVMEVGVGPDCEYDLVSADIDRVQLPATNFTNFVGGNYCAYSLTPTTGHVTFGPICPGTGVETTGNAYADGAGLIILPLNGDTATLTIPFALHGITSFQNVAPRFAGRCPGAISTQAIVQNAGGATGGTFTITIYDNAGALLGTTAAIAFNATTAAVDAAIEAVTGAGTVTAVSGNLTTGYTITFNVTRSITADGALLTGGTAAGTIQYYGVLTRTLTGESYPGIEFACRVPGTSWPAYQNLTAANLSTAISGLVGYSAGGSGLEIRIKITATGDMPNRNLQVCSLLTNVDASLWILQDSFIVFNGVNATDVVRVRRLSDLAANPPINLYTFTGGGLQRFDLGNNVDTEVYFVRENAAGVQLMTTYPTTKILQFDDNGEVDLFYGVEVQLAQSSDVDSIKAKVDSYLDAAISSRLAAADYVPGGGGASAADVWTYATRALTTTGNSGVATAVRSELTTELGRIDTTVSSRLATSGYTAPPSAANNATAVRSELATELGRIDVATSTRLATSGYTAPPSVSAIRTEMDSNSTKLDVAVSTRLATSGYTAPPSASTNATAVRSELAAELGRIDVATSTRLATSGYTAPPSASANATAVRSELSTELGRIDVAISTRNAVAPDNAAITAIKAKTDNLPAAPASVGDIPSPSQVASQVRTELTTELGRIDVAVSSRNAVAPDNASITAIKAKTDNIPVSPATESKVQEAIDAAKLAAALSA